MGVLSRVARALVGDPRRIANSARNVLLFRAAYPWVRHGRNFHCHVTTLFRTPTRKVSFGDDCGVGNYCLFIAETRVADSVLIASHVAFVNRDDHKYDVVGKTIPESGRGADREVVVESDVWIGHGATILAPVRLGRGCIVAAGSLVREDVPRYAIVGGVPARVLKMRFTPDQIREHERLLIENAQMRADDRTKP